MRLPAGRAAACSATSFASNTFINFGMGFVSNTSGSTDETLFVAGGGMSAIGSGSATLGTIAMPSLATAQLGTVAGSPELTGTGDAKLWGFYPDTTPPKVDQIDKTNGAESNEFKLPTLQGTPAAWAFAFWGGDFWIFLKRSNDNSTKVYHLKSADGSITTAIANTGRTIVGAGVSTCAPINPIS